MNKALLLVVVAILSASCTNRFTEVSHRNIIRMHSSPTFKGHFYVGSDPSFHYFTSKWKYRRNTKKKVDREHIKIHKEFPLNSDEIRLCPWNPKKYEVEEFGKTEDRTLYNHK